MAKRIVVLLRVVNLGNPRNIVLDGGPNFPHGFDAALAKLLKPLVNILSHAPCKFLSEGREVEILLVYD